MGVGDDKSGAILFLCLKHCQIVGQAGDCDRPLFKKTGVLWGTNLSLTSTTNEMKLTASHHVLHDLHAYIF